MIKVSQDLRDYIFNYLSGVLKDKDTHKKLIQRFNESFNLPEELLEIDNTKPYFKTSMLPRCPRKEYYRLQGIAPVLTPESFLTLTGGNYIHHLLQICLEDILVDKEQMLLMDLGNYQILGKYDGVINFQNELSLIEVKSMSPFATEKLFKELAEAEKDYASIFDRFRTTKSVFDILLQANMYVKLLQGKYDIKKIWIIIYSKASVKDIPPIFTFWADYDETIVEIGISKANLIFKHLQENTIPEKSPYSWECHYCDYVNCEFNKRREKEGAD